MSMTTAPERDRLDDAAVPIPQRRQVQVPQLLAAILLIAGSALAFVLYTSATNAKVQVLAMGTDVARGDAVELTDLRVIAVAADQPVEAVAADASDQVVGRVAAVDLSPGMLVSASMLVDDGALAPGQGVAGMSLTPGQYPSPRLVEGDWVAVMVVVDEAGTAVETLSGGAEVVAVEPVGAQGNVFVSVVADDDTAQRIATATGDLRLVQVPADATLEPATPPAGEDTAADGAASEPTTTDDQTATPTAEATP